jgi:two-component system, OmpR family, phosphate regulon sensor histidine kinase PhoR
MMFDLGKIPPKRIALIFSVIIAAFVTGAALLLYVPLKKTAILSVTTFLFAWLLSDKYLYGIIDKRVKIIYKSIYTKKNTKRQDFYNEAIIPKDTLYDVEIKVNNWMQEEEQRQVLQLQNEQYRKQFFQNMSHELKTPIFAIKGYLEILEDGGIENKDIALKYVINSKKNIDRLSTLVLDMDEITRLEQGEQLLQPGKFDIHDCMVEVVESLSSLLAPKNIQYSFKKDSYTKAFVIADKQKIKQVLTNLCENAIKYGKQNGAILLGIYKPDSTHYLIEVSDDGYGIAEKHLSRVFERFYRTDEARSRNVGGSGLGLAICKHIIEAHGQIIYVRSTIDVGSTFSFTLEKA